MVKPMLRADLREGLKVFLSGKNRKRPVVQIFGARGVGKSFVIDRAIEQIRGEVLRVAKRSGKYESLTPEYVFEVLKSEFPLTDDRGMTQIAWKNFPDLIQQLDEKSASDGDGGSYRPVIWLEASQLPSPLLQAIQTHGRKSRFLFERHFGDGTPVEVKEIYGVGAVQDAELDDAIHSMVRGEPLAGATADYLRHALERFCGRNFGILAEVIRWIAEDKKKSADGDNYFTLRFNTPRGGESHLQLLAEQRRERRLEVVRDFVASLSKSVGRNLMLISDGHVSGGASSLSIEELVDKLALAELQLSGIICGHPLRLAGIMVGDGFPLAQEMTPESALIKDILDHLWQVLGSSHGDAERDRRHGEVYAELRAATENLVDTDRRLVVQLCRRCDCYREADKSGGGRKGNVAPAHADLVFYTMARMLSLEWRMSKWS